MCSARAWELACLPPLENNEFSSMLEASMPCLKGQVTLGLLREARDTAFLPWVFFGGGTESPPPWYLT